MVIGVGGSASSDGATGALRALGFRFLDADGDEVDPVTDAGIVVGVDSSAADPRLRDTRFELCADVLSPMIGDQGSARVFGPQKGADAETVEVLERRLTMLASLYADIDPQSGEVAGAGGAGGAFAGGAMALLHARARAGIDSLAEILALDSHLAAADVVVVGEGSMDAQSRFGKAPIGIARRARDHGVPAIAVPGASTFSGDDLIDDGIVVIATATAAARADGGDALASAARYLTIATASAVAHYLSMPGG